MADESKCSQCGNPLPADAPQGICPQCLMKLGLPSEAESAVTSNGEPNQNKTQKNNIPADGFVPLEPSVLAEQFTQLEIIELLGHGGMGAVYKAKQKHLDRFVALKILSPHIARMEAFAERFVREARSLAKLNHPGIVTVYDFGQSQSGLYYFIMEYIDGTDLRQVLRAGQLSPVEAIKIVPRLCETLQYAHQQGIVHRDIKPENILISKDGQVKIADFGLARLVGKSANIYTLTQTGQKMGTPHYMAPEQIEQPHSVDHRADIYSLGVVFYEMLTGELPLGRFPLPSRKVHIDVRLDEVVLKTLEKEPQLRYQHASEVKNDVETIVTTAQPEKIVPDDVIENARRAVHIPAIGLLIAGAIHCMFFLGTIRNFNLVLNIFLPVFTVFIILGALNLLQMHSYRMAFIGSALALFTPSVGTAIGLPMGIWALIVLSRQQVKSAFGAKPGEKIIPPKVFEVVASATEQANQAVDKGINEVGKFISSQKSGELKTGKFTFKTPKGKALWSFSLGLISFLFSFMGFAQGGNHNTGLVHILSFPLAVIAIYLGIKALKAIGPDKDKEYETDKILAIVGIAAGGISVLFMLGFIF